MLDRDHPPNIYIVGPQCTGKTTLVNFLEKKTATDNTLFPSKPHIISEVARPVMAEHRFTTEEIESSPDRSLALQRLIIDAQAGAENEALREATWFISDRSGIDPIVYTRKYVSVEAAGQMQQSSTWLELRGRMANSLTILCKPDTEWLKDDGFRLMPKDLDDWMQFYHSFRELLDANHLKYHVLPSGLPDSEARSDLVLFKWHEHMASGMERN